MNKQDKFNPYLIWICAAIFYVYQFILRVSPSLIVDDLMGFFTLDASGVAQLTAIAMYAYAIMQIPGGLTVDAFGVRRVLLFSVSACLLGVTCFVFSENLWLARFGRLLLGVGSAPAILCVAKISALWFSPKRRAVLLGMTMAMGTIGGYLGNIVLSRLVEAFGWRETLLSTHIVGGLTLALVYFVIPGRESELSITYDEETSKAAVFEQLRELLRNKKVWLYSLAAVGIYLCVAVIADLWGLTFIMESHGVTKAEAARVVSLMYVGLCFGSVAITSSADYFGIRLGLIQVCLVVQFLCASLFIHFPNLSVFQLGSLCFAIGFCTGAEMLCFANINDFVGKKSSATATGLVNGIVMLGGAFVAEQVGVLLDFFWNGDFLESGIRLYRLSDYRQSLTLVLIVVFGSVLISMGLPKKQQS